MSKYNLFLETSDKFIPFKVEGTHQVLPTGAYRPTYDWDKGTVFFNKIDVKSDDLVDLPSAEFEYVLNQMKHFLKPETKEAFKDNGFLYKRSVLLHGRPGTGKTCIVSRVVKEALANDAVVLFNPDPEAMQYYFEALDATAPDKLTLVIFEELDGIVARPSNEAALLSILDGEVQKNNIMYLATTNYLENIPLRIQRPGRFSSIVEVGFPDAVARAAYLTAKKVTEGQENWVATTEGFSVDELKETVLAVKCLDEALETVVARINALKSRGLESESRKKAREEEEDDFQSFAKAQAKAIRANRARGY